MNSTAFIYYLTLINARVLDCIIRLNYCHARLLSCTDSSKPGWFHVETYMRVLEL